MARRSQHYRRAIVSGSFQEFDQEYLIHALETLNGQFVGTTQLPISTPDEVIKKLNELGIRGVRFNVKREVLKI